MSGRAITTPQRGERPSPLASVAARPRRPLAPIIGLCVLAAAGAVMAGGVAPKTRSRTVPGHAPRVRVELPVTATDIYDKPSNNSPQLAADPTDRRFVALANRLDAPFNCALQVSGDAGRTWVTALPVRELPAGADTCYSPEVGFDSEGTLHYLFVGLANPGNRPMGVFLTSSVDRGRSFSPPRQVLGPHHYQVRMAIDSRGGHMRIHLVWLQAGDAPPLGGLPTTDNPIMAAYSDDGGATFSAPQRVSDTARRRAVAPAVAIGADHAVHVLYYDLQDDARDYQGLEGPRWDGTWSLVLSSSIDGGKSFGRGVVVDDEVMPPERVMLIFTMPPPSLATDGRGHVYAGWHDRRLGDSDVYLRASADHGQSWEAPVRVNDDPEKNGLTQYLPRVSVSPNGRVDVVFYDRRNNIENRGNDVYYTHSTDGGLHFAPNVKLTSLDSDSTVGPRYAVPSAGGLVEIGGRLATLSESRSVLAAWTDMRYSGAADPSQDIFATRIEYPRPPRVPSLLRWAGFALLVLAGSTAAAPAVGTRLGRDE